MIKINLLGDETAIDQTAKLQVFAYLASLVLAIGVFYLMQSSVNESNAELASRAETLQNDLIKVQKITKEVKDLETKKSEYNSKLVVIARLKKSKAGPVRVMDDMNMALPEKSWITDVKEQNGVFKIMGRAIDDPTIATFMRDLEKSDYFEEAKDVTIKRVDQDGVKIREFIFQAVVSYTGKLGKDEDEEKSPKSKTEKQASILKKIFG